MDAKNAIYGNLKATETPFQGTKIKSSRIVLYTLDLGMSRKDKSDWMTETCSDKSGGVYKNIAQL